MRISTDSCFFGAVAPAQNAEKILDIGTGTGLLALMLAQRFISAKIDAIETDENAATTAEENFEKSPFSTNLHCFRGDVKSYIFEKKYDFIICNPPFYETSLISEQHNKNVAMHNLGLRAHELAKLAADLLHENGMISVMYPPDRSANFIKLMLFWKFFLVEKHFLYNLKKGKKMLFREILTFSWKNTLQIEKNTDIWQEENVYSEEFKQILKDFYIIF